MINNIHYEEALNNILIVVIAAAVVLVLVMLLGSKKSRFRKKLSTFFADDTVGTAKHPMEFNREYYITGEKNMRKPAKTKVRTQEFEDVCLQTAPKINGFPQQETNLNQMLIILKPYLTE